MASGVGPSYAIHRRLTGELLAQMEPMWLVWMPTARTTEANPIQDAPEKRAWL